MSHRPTSRTVLMRVAPACLAVVPALIDQASETTNSTTWALTLTCLGVSLVALLWRAQHPLPSFAVVLVVGIAVEMTSAALDESLSTLVVLPLAFGFYAIGRHCDRRTSTLVALGSAALMLAALAVNQLTAPTGQRGGLDVVAVVAALPFAWALGQTVRSRDLSLATARSRIAEARVREQLRVRQAASDERMRIARDMHDSVAHSLSTLVIHAEVLRSRSPELAPWVEERVDAMAESARQASHELHGILSVLRQEDSEPTNATRDPDPVLDSVPTLIDTSRAAGNEVSLELEGDLGGLPVLVQSGAYRILQEALSNCRGHAPGSAVLVRVANESGMLVIRVANAAPETAVRRPDSTSGGLGLVGMRERVAALGGQLEVGPVRGGGFLVHVELPVSAQ
ncbi:MAG: sensor histidine kinase [Nocardioidaceae bacterium]